LGAQNQPPPPPPPPPQWAKTALDMVITQNLFHSMDFNNFSTSFALFARN